MATSGELGDLIQRTSKRLRRAYIGALAPLGLTPAQERALLTITRAGEPIRMGALAERMDIVPRSVTSLVDALEDAGLVSRTMDPDNRRSILLALTQKGTAVQRVMAEARAAAAAEIFAPLTPTQRAQLAGLLELLDLPRHHHP
ncbi:MarR family transcriptional regulator [Nakamurella silvestris]|nr:MarR family transcriptional regulator [Nakamurella silvestris]